MESQMKMMVVFGLVAAVFLQNVAAQSTVLVVGDAVGWTEPQNDAQLYASWAANQTFVVGDTLIFNFATNVHDVVEVPKASFDSCSDDNKISNIITTGPANVSLTTDGEHYYICSVGNHCKSGQKLAINVTATATSPGTSVPSPSTNTTTTPNSSSPAVGAGFVLCLLSVVMGIFF